jgi:hypothetical protein
MSGASVQQVSMLSCNTFLFKYSWQKENSLTFLLKTSCRKHKKLSVSVDSQSRVSLDKNLSLTSETGSLSPLNLETLEMSFLVNPNNSREHDQGLDEEGEEESENEGLCRRVSFTDKDGCLVCSIETREGFKWTLHSTFSIKVTQENYGKILPFLIVLSLTKGIDRIRSFIPE